MGSPTMQYMVYAWDKKELGILGERIAERFLLAKGYKVLDKNFKTKWGEIDLVAKKKKGIVFVEVKTIRKKQGFAAEDEISRKKKMQLRKMAQIYLAQKRMPPETLCQIDILAIEIGRDFKRAKIKHFKNAIEDTG